MSATLPADSRYSGLPWLKGGVDRAGSRCSGWPGLTFNAYGR